MGMNKQTFINKLRWFAANEGAGLPDEYGHPDYAPSRGESMLAGMLARWLDESGVPDGDGTSAWTRDLPEYVVEAYSEFATDPKWELARDAYHKATDHDIPDLIDAYAGGIHRTLVAHSVCRLLPLLADAKWLRPMLESSLNAQMLVIDHVWRRFVRIAYRKLMPRIKSELHRGNVGVFGSTKLLTFDCAGRVMFTFQRDSGTITYIADASDMYGNRSGPNAPGAPYAECVAMIEDVIAHWDADKLQRSDTIGIG